MLFYVLSRLGSIRRGFACYTISYHALAVYAEALHAILHLITPWKCPAKDKPPKPELRKLKSKEQSRTAKAQATKTRGTKAQVEQE